MINPQEHDEKIAAKYFRLEQAQQELKVSEHKIVRAAGVQERIPAKRGWGFEEVYLPFKEALDVCNSNTLSNAYTIAQDLIASLIEEVDELEQSYTGWSRFFLVTSSAGHIHSSMNCSSCYVNTAYGWLPELSGKTEAEAVEQCGPALCSVCFSSAPVVSQASKLTKSAAQKMAWSPDRDEKIAKAAKDKEEKATKKAAKEAKKLKYDESLAHKVNTLIDMFGADSNDMYEWTWTNKGYDNAHFVISDMNRRAR